MARHVMTARRRAALRKAQLVSARKRKRGSRRRKVAVGVAGTIAVGSVLGYRKYDRGQELAQHRHLTAKAHNALWKANIHGGDGDEYWHSVKVPAQPRRYRNRPKSQQTKLSIAQHRKSVFGKTASRAGRVITKPSPVNVKISKRSTPYAPFTPAFRKMSYNGYKGRKSVGQLQQRVGKSTYTVVGTLQRKR